ncbi:hypothetical protein F4860DRAFT_129288 [Xylaria cubensis]|nr:hypothetical protein F4860DRAFT_129288 [Xylaria cubensis]
MTATRAAAGERSSQHSRFLYTMLPDCCYSPSVSGRQSVLDDLPRLPTNSTQLASTKLILCLRHVSFRCDWVYYICKGRAFSLLRYFHNPFPHYCKVLSIFLHDLPTWRKERRRVKTANLNREPLAILGPGDQGRSSSHPERLPLITTTALALVGLPLGPICFGILFAYSFMSNYPYSTYYLTPTPLTCC